MRITNNDESGQIEVRKGTTVDREGKDLSGVGGRPRVAEHTKGIATESRHAEMPRHVAHVEGGSRDLKLDGGT